MNFDIFDENYYLAKYPDVKAAKDAGLIASGLAHFEQFGRQEGRTLISPYYDESFYRANNPDVDNAVKAGVFASGLDHLIQFGYSEGRTQISPYYVESFYLQSNPDVAAAVGSGTFKSGLQHYIKFGAGENRITTSFLEPEYLIHNPDVAAAVRAGAFSSGLEHYLKFGQFEPSRNAVFSGTRGNDIVTAFGVGKMEITGVEQVYGVRGNVYESKGENEFDTLIGRSGSDTFMLGDILSGHTPASTVTVEFYAGGAGEARIVGFNPSEGDSIRMVRNPENYRVFSSGSDLIIAFGEDRIAVLEGKAGLTLTPTNVNPYGFTFV